MYLLFIKRLIHLFDNSNEMPLSSMLGFRNEAYIHIVAVRSLAGIGKCVALNIDTKQ